jgi:hypothetical protein
LENLPDLSLLALPMVGRVKQLEETVDTKDAHAEGAWA